jgi:hypothetical protein
MAVRRGAEAVANPDFGFTFNSGDAMLFSR